MTSPDVVAEVHRWFRFAEEDLDAAESLLRDESFVPRHVCWLSQQAAEKSITSTTRSALRARHAPSLNRR